MQEDEWDDEQDLVEVAKRLKEGRQVLSMTVYAVQHGRRTPDQVRGVLDRSSRAIHRNRIVRTKWRRARAVH